MLFSQIKAIGKITRYSYPSYQEIIKDGKKVRERIQVTEAPGRPYVFKRSQFVTASENESVEINDENTFLKDGLDSTEPGQTNGSVSAAVAPRTDDRLPF